MSGSLPRPITALRPTLPPGFHAVPTADPWGAALRSAAQGDRPEGAPGTVLHAPLEARCHAAIQLAPDRPVADEAILHLAALALRDALSGLVPPEVSVELTLPRGVAVNGAEAGSLRVARGPGAPPEWIVLEIDIAVALRDPDPGRSPWRTDLAEEGCGASATDVLEAICRQLLSWFDRWQEEGDAAIEAAWRRAPKLPAREPA
jgi:hypothetical protein